MTPERLRDYLPGLTRVRPSRGGSDPSEEGVGARGARTVTGVTSDRPLPLPFIAPVAGISHRQEVACRVSVEDTVVLRREPTNPYDAHAVAIEIGEELLGYLPRALALRLDGPGPWRGEVSEVLDGQFIGVRVRVLAVDPGRTTPRQERLADLTTVQPAHAVTDAQVITEVPVDVPVHALSGRLLGVLARRGEDTVVVRTDTGEVGYPAHLVSITPA